MLKTLDEIMIKYGSDKANWCHDYCKWYEQYLESIRDKPVILLELGIGGEEKELGGASLRAWEEYFPQGLISGIDIYPKGALDTDRIRTYTGSQVDESFLRNVIAMIGRPDIIIDDASHQNDLTIKSFQILFSLLRPGGLYVIEDLCCSYRWDFGGTSNLKDMNAITTMNYLFSMLHNLNPVRVADQSYVDIDEFKDVESVHFYPDMVVIKKK